MLDDEWKTKVERRLDDHMERLDAGDERMNALTKQLEENTDITKRIDQNTAKLVNTFRAIDGFGTVGQWIFGAIVKVSIVITAAGVIYWFLHTGELPRAPGS